MLIIPDNWFINHLQCLTANTILLTAKFLELSDYSITIGKTQNMQQLKTNILLVVLLAATNAFGQPNYPTDPEEGQLVFVDVENFLSAYQRLTPQSDTIALLQSEYFDKASQGLKEYISRHGLTPQMLVEAMQSNPEAYESISSFMSNFQPFNSKYTSTLQTFKKVVPTAMFPPTYLLIGANRGIAQASKVGQLVTITRMMGSDEHLLKFIIHELSHFQQVMTVGINQYSALFSQENNMLGLCLREGAAEFVTQMVMNDITQTEALEYLNSHKKALKKRFRKDLSAQDKKFWLWESLDNKEVPKLLGYAIGYDICNAYYTNAPEKGQAMQEILGIVNAEEFLEMSNYLTK